MQIGDERTRGLPVINIDQPTGLYDGNRAMTIQTYNEANSKNGKNFELSALFENVSTGVPAKAIFLTGSLPVILKSRTFGYTGSAIKADVFTGPTYTGGAPATIYNTNDINPVASTVTILQGATITDDGVQLAASTYLLGGTKNQDKGSASIASGTEYVFKPNTAYLFSVQSLDSATQDIAVHNGWYEGEPDLPLEEI